MLQVENNTWKHARNDLYVRVWETTLVSATKWTNTWKRTSSSSIKLKLNVSDLADWNEKCKEKNRFLHTENRGNPCSTLGIQPKPGLFTVVERKFEPFEAYLFLHCLLFTTVYPGHGSRNETKMVALVLFFFPFSFFVPTFIFFFSRWFAWTRPTTIRAAWIMLSFWDPPQVSRRFNALGKLFHCERLINFPAFSSIFRRI